MAKKSRKRSSRFEKHQSGCMWSLLNIFDFRHARFSQKLLPDRKRGGKCVIGAGYAEITLESLSDSCEIVTENAADVQSETPIIDTCKISVKALMEEEMFGEQDQKKYAKNQLRSRSKIDLESDDFVVDHELVSEKPIHRKHEPSSSIDLNVMVEELCSRIHQKDASYFERGQDGELATQTIIDLSVIEEKLCEATKVLVNHFTHEKNFNKSGKVQHSSRELMNALQILNSNKEAFLKLLKDPNSLLVKQIQGLQDIQVEEGKFKVLTGSELLDQDIGDSKQQNYFWRRFKGMERNSSKKSETSEDLNRIIILKPGPLGSRNLDVPVSPPLSIVDKVKIQRTSPFSFSEFKRKLKHAMRKEHHGVTHNGICHQSSNEALMINRDKKISGETFSMASPSRDHFFIERIPKSKLGLKKVDKTGKQTDVKILLEHYNDLPSEKKASNIYVEAKKHLAEMVGRGDVDVETRSKQVPKPLGRILSFSGYTSPMMCSPRTDKDMRLSLDAEYQTQNDNTCRVIKQISPHPQANVTQESETSDKSIQEAEISGLEPCLSEDLPIESSVENPTIEAEFCATKVGADVVRSSDADTSEESNLIEISFRSCDQSEMSFECAEENHVSACLGKDVHDEKEVLSSQITSTLTCSVSEKMNDSDVTSDATSKPSPVSVLEPFFKEDNISPPSIKSFTVIESFQPRQIHFEAEISSPLDRVSYNRNSTEDTKYTFEFVKAVVQMSGLTWDELLNKSLFSDHLVDPDLINEVDFLPDYLPCDFNLLFCLINEILVEIYRVNFGSMLSFSKPFVQPNSTGKDIFSETWKQVDSYLKLDGGTPCTLDQIVTKDFGKSGVWMDLQLDGENIGIEVQHAILEELMEELLQDENPIFTSTEAQDSEIGIEL